MTDTRLSNRDRETSIVTSISSEAQPAGDRILHRWTARRLHPVILLWVALVFLGFMVVAFWGFQSTDAVKALALTAVGSILPLGASVLTRDEYEMSEAGLVRRPVRGSRPGEFKTVFAWTELSHVKPVHHGIKYYRPLDEPRAWARFWKQHVSDAYSGEFHVETNDRDPVLAVIAKRGIPIGGSSVA
jgi:hypothetical protein